MLLGKYTYSQMHSSKKFYCSKRRRGCKASVALHAGGAIAAADVHHTHPPDDFLITKSGAYVKI
ncbi:hypothetical protein JYU34_004371 [Plutella xylostella]|uniref:FLYWCH-type domain-containing protein n=1 Tax=Plutella xylostella TaxID=51655 RepID=A0ABQ7QXT0_PLUXY|nr:hypothetical protein JYU34_004371 [Plutella xylostella]